MKKSGMDAEDLSEDEMSKDHARYMLGGKVVIEDERVFRFGEYDCGRRVGAAEGEEQ